MPFEFPNAPVAGTTHTEFGVDYVYDGSVWNLASGGAMTDYVLKAGDTMTGALELYRLTLRSGGYNSGAAGVQINFGYNNTLGYRHELRTNHGYTNSDSWFEFWINADSLADPAIRACQISGTQLWAENVMNAASYTDRTLLADPAMEQFAVGKGKERGVDLGKVLLHALAKIKELKAEIATMRGADAV